MHLKCLCSNGQVCTNSIRPTNANFAQINADNVNALRMRCVVTLFFQE